MKSSTKSLTRRFTLGKEEILRGYGVFEEVLNNSEKLGTKFLTAFVRKDTGINTAADVTNVPNVRVGFLLSKKKLKEPSTATA